MDRRADYPRLHFLCPTPVSVRRGPLHRSRGAVRTGRAAARIRSFALYGATGVVPLKGWYARLDFPDPPQGPAARKQPHAVDRVRWLQCEPNTDVRRGAAAVV